MFSDFEKVYGAAEGRRFEHTALVAHRGVLIGFAMDDAQRIHYAIQNLEGAEDATNADVSGWSHVPVELPFPAEIARAGYRQISLVALAAARGDAFRSTTARLTADAPFQVLSDGQDVYLFRQSLPGTHSNAREPVGERTEILADDNLLVDRFVLVGATLQPKTEVRFQRSRHKTKPLNKTDSLGARDLNGDFFIEPTQRLQMVHNLAGGRFAVQLLPSALPGRQRWQIFSHNDKTGFLESFNIERGDDGLFHTAGTRYYTCPEAHTPEVFETAPGLCQRGHREKLIVIGGEPAHGNKALQFQAERDAMVLLDDHRPVLGDAWTVEAWIRTPLAQSKDGNVLLSCGEGGLQVGVRDGKLGLWLNDAFHAAKHDLLTDEAWHHLAVVSEGKTSFFINGLPKVPPLGVTGKGTVVCIGNDPARPRPFGALDELRIWGAARTIDELRAHKDQRLIGEEPDLLAYWRFDEGGGITVRDMTRHARTARLTGEGLWVRSDAPVGDHPGVSRDRFEITGHTLESGLAARLYYQQENTPAGYRGDPKPAKNAARLMLTMAVRATGGAGNALATLDFGVSRYGKLAQSPTALALQALSPDPSGALPLPLLHLDPLGLTIAGGTLAPPDGAPADSAPTLLDGADGRLTLLVRGGKDQAELLAAHFDTRTSRARFRLHTTAGHKAYVIARPTGPLQDRLTITVTKGAVTTTKVGSLQTAVSGEVEALPLARPCAIPLGTRQQLRVGDAVVVTYGGARKGATSIPIVRQRLNLNAGAEIGLEEAHGTVEITADLGATTVEERWEHVPLAVRKFVRVLNGDASTDEKAPDYYDYAKNATPTPGFHLGLGSVLVRVGTDSTILGDAIKPVDRAEPIPDATPGTRWVPDAPNDAVALEDGQHFSYGPRTALKSNGQQTVTLAKDGVAVLADPSAFTVEWWLCPDALPHNHCQTIGVGGVWTGFLFHSSADGKIYVGIGPTPGSRFETGITNQVNLGRWQHFALTRDASGRAAFYQDGELLGSMAEMRPSRAGPWKTFVLGEGAPGFTGPSGLIDEIRVWSRARTQAEIRADRFERLRAPQPGLAACWSFERDAATAKLTARDHAGRGLHGEVDGDGADLGPSFFPFPPQVALEADDRTSLTIKGPASAPPLLKKENGTPFTVEWWLFPNALDDFSAVLGAATRATDQWGDFLFHSARDGRVFVGTDTASRIIAPSGTVSAGRWQHFALTRSGTGDAVFYKDGEVVAEKAKMAQSNGSWSNFTIGVQKGSYKGFDARIAELRVWSRVRTPEELRAARFERIRAAQPALAVCASFEADKDGAPYAKDHTGRSLTSARVGTGARLVSARLPGEPPVDGSPAFDNDLTIEAWVQPTRVEEGKPQTVLHQCGAGGDYSLGLAYQKTGPALQMNARAGDTDRVLCPALEATGPASFTVEFWCRISHPSTSTHWLLDWLASGDFGLKIGIIHPGQNQDICVVQYGKHLPIRQDFTPEHDGWTHIAFRVGFMGVLRPGIFTMSLTINGTPLSTEPLPLGKSVLPDRALILGAGLSGVLHDVRVWSRPLSDEFIRRVRGQTLTGAEDGLLANWRFDGLQVRDHGPQQRHGRIEGRPTNVVGPPHTTPTPGCAIRFSAGQASFQSGALPLNATAGLDWTHIAASFRQSWALQLDGEPETVIDCGKDASLDLTGDLTLEAWVRFDALDRPQGILTRGGQSARQGQSFSLFTTLDGGLAFAFRDGAGAPVLVQSKPRLLTAGTFYRVAVTRENKREYNQDTNKLRVFSILSFYVNGEAAGAESREDLPDAGSCSASLELGRAYPNGQPAPLRGVLSQVRIWNTVRDAHQISRPIRGDETGLVGWWRMEERAGAFAYDAKGSSHGKLTGTWWVHNPDPAGSSAEIYVNGRALSATSAPAAAYGPAQFTLGGVQTGARLSQPFSGQLDEVRVWRTERSRAQIRDNLFRRLEGERDLLIARYRFDRGDAPRARDCSGNGHDLSASAPLPTWSASTAPVGEEAAPVRGALNGNTTAYQAAVQASPAAGEYGTIGYTADGSVTGVLKRCTSYVSGGRWHLFTGFKVGDLVTEWLSQVQYAPQLIGYIEGAPPVPGENMTVRYAGQSDLPDYKGASRIEFKQAESQTRTYATSRETGFDAQIEASLKAGFKAGTTTATGVPVALVINDLWSIYGKIGARASWEHSASHTRDSQSSASEALTQASEMSLHGHWSKRTDPHGHRFTPDNVGFALVQSATADLFAMRLAHNNVLVGHRVLPNPDIPRDWNIITFPINPRYVKQGILDGRLGTRSDPDYEDATGRGEYSYYKPQEAYTLKQRIVRERQRLKDNYQQREPVAGQSTSPELHRRNIVNTYVWTADGGFFAEATETMDATETHIVSSTSNKWMAGVGVEGGGHIGPVTLDVEMSAMAGGHLIQVSSKSEDSATGFSLDVGLNIERDLQQYDERGEPKFDEKTGRTPLLMPGKVDAYRFMSFYLQPSEANFEEFRHKVVDPTWLRTGPDPRAAALREALHTQSTSQDQKSQPWRILHRVTYRSRVLPGTTGQNAAQLEHLDAFSAALAAAGLESNHALAMRLAPYVRACTHDHAAFTDAVREAVRERYPDLVDVEDDIVADLCDYLGVYPLG